MHYQIYTPKNGEIIGHKKSLEDFCKKTPHSFELQKAIARPATGDQFYIAYNDDGWDIAAILHHGQDGSVRLYGDDTTAIHAIATKFQNNHDPQEIGYFSGPKALIDSFWARCGSPPPHRNDAQSFYTKNIVPSHTMFAAASEEIGIFRGTANPCVAKENDIESLVKMRLSYMQNTLKTLPKDAAIDDDMMAQVETEITKAVTAGEIFIFKMKETNDILAMVKIAIHENQAMVSSVMTKEHAQRKGLAKRLLDFAIGTVLQKNPTVEKISLHADEKIAGPFYVKLGFIKKAAWQVGVMRPYSQKPVSAPVRGGGNADAATMLGLRLILLFTGKPV
jgi:GNAT superfamily N-acetyltransferase